MIKKLGETSVDTGLLRSSKQLGRIRDTKKEALGRALREKRAGIGGDLEHDVLFERRPSVHSEDSSSSQSSDGEVTAKRFDSLPPAAITGTPNGLALGAGLKRPLEVDDAGNPVIQQRERLKRAKRTPVIAQPSPSDEESDWEGFSSASSNEDQDLSDSGSGPSNDDDSMLDDDSDLINRDDHMSETSEESIPGDDDDDGSAKGAAQERSSIFKAWATKQRNEVIGFTPSVPADHQSSQVLSNVLRNQRQPSTKLGVQLKPQSDRNGTASGKAFNVTVERPPGIEKSRLELPVVAKEQEIMETIFSNDCTIVTGATGSGKTTQVPQFLFEAGYGNSGGPTPGMIGVTQPRRVAAVSMAKRVAFEMGSQGDKVSHQVRFDSSVGSKTAMKFMTDGVLLREISQDFTLSKYSAIVIDEAHERSVNTDILIGMLSRIVETRSRLAIDSDKHRPLKLIIMSATLRIADFTKNKTLFRGETPPVLEAEGKSHDVTVHFSRKTQRDYVDDVYQKVGRGHRKLPPGAMLVFLTGQNEISHVERRLKDAFEATEATDPRQVKMRISANETSIEAEDVDLGGRAGVDKDDASDSDVSIQGTDARASGQDEGEFDIEPEEVRSMQKVHVLPLYSQLPNDQQMRVFQPPPEGSRLIVLATNVAETSLTIPNIRYVFDCGRAKEKSYETTTGVQSFNIDWISKANAEQRRGRAGRTGPGHCYRLYSSAVYENHFVEHALPEIQRTPVEGVVIQLKSMGIPNVAHFPFPTPPDRESLVKAERLLEYLGAIVNGGVSAIGKKLSVYPLSPRLSRILVAASDQKCVSQAIALVALLAVPDVYVTESQRNIRDPAASADASISSRADLQEATLREPRRKEYNTFHGHAARIDRQSDAVKLLTVFADYTDDPSSITIRTHTHVKALQEALQLRAQLTRLVATHSLISSSDILSTLSTRLTAPTSTEAKVLRHLIAAGYIDQIAQRADLSPTPPVYTRKPARSIDVPYITLFASHEEASKQSTGDDDAAAREKASHVYIHASSVLAHTPIASLPQYIIYSHLSRAPAATVSISDTATASRPPRTRLHPLTPVAPEQILHLAKGTPLLGEGKPVGRIETLPRGADGAERRQCWTVPFLRGGVGGREWPLPPARRVVQRREGKHGWVVEESGGV